MAFKIFLKKEELETGIRSGKGLIIGFVSNNLDILEQETFQKNLSLASINFEQIEFIYANIDQSNIAEVYNDICTGEKAIPVVCGFKDGKILKEPVISPSVKEISNLAQNLLKNEEAS